MRLTQFLAMKKHIKGHLFRGKYRLVKIVTPNAKQMLIEDYQQQEENMVLLMKPYLTLEQSSGHAKALKKGEKMMQKFKDEAFAQKQRPNITIWDRLSHLDVKNNWE
uniref:Putative ribosomal protein 63 mitochondrial n=1 Tax=Corethrella appendiculata TaxID=1370023 RepID=U5EU22_9DIPT